MLFATTYQAAGEWMPFRTAAYFTGWAAAMLFWVSAFAALRCGRARQSCPRRLRCGSPVRGHARRLLFVYLLQRGVCERLRRRDVGDRLVRAAEFLRPRRWGRSLVCCFSCGRTSSSMLWRRCASSSSGLPVEWRATGSTHRHQTARSRRPACARSDRVGGREPMDDRIMGPAAVCLWRIRIPVHGSRCTRRSGSCSRIRGVDCSSITRCTGLPSRPCSLLRGGADRCDCCGRRLLASC